MVTDEERDYMWAEYAKDPRMRANIGIRRRHEIGMGDNIWLGDRDAVRTPRRPWPRRPRCCTGPAA